MPRRANWEPGNIFEIALPTGGFAYGVTVEFPLIAVFNFRANERPALPKLLSTPVAFRIWVMRSCIGPRCWPVIGFESLPETLRVIPDFYKYDSIAHQFSLYRGHAEERATREECLGLERAAVWSSVHVESRLEDYFAGRPNAWVEILNAERNL